MPHAISWSGGCSVFTRALMSSIAKVSNGSLRPAILLPGEFYPTCSKVQGEENDL